MEVNMNNIAQKLNEHKSSTTSKWREEAEFRAANKEWLRYSQHIAMMMLDKMGQLGMTQKSLAEKMGCSQQYVSKILKGRENLSIETLCKIETALELSLLPQMAETY
jgi:ribosome-binding protein aMBF1 (putative translation factor)